MGVPWRLRSYQEKQEAIKTFRFYLIFCLSLFVVYQSVISFFGKPYRTDNQGMAPTIEVGDLFIINPIYAWWPGGAENHWPKRGEIILIHSLGEEKKGFFRGIFEPFLRLLTMQQLGFRTQKSKLGMPSVLLKRVIALPGDWIKAENNTIYVRPRGSMYFVTEFEASSQVYEIKPSKIAEEWRGIAHFSSDFLEFQLGKNEIFVLGDNREQINDSRSFGPLELSQIAGRVDYIYWPIQKLNVIEQRKASS
ncbi:MAG: signal peptidase I [Spirochaetia bacterium]